MKLITSKVENWFIERNLHSLDGRGQLEKLNEEVGELIQAYKDEDRDEEIDAVGDIMVVLIGYCLQRNLSLKWCLESAYEEIKDRRGRVVDGIFIKESDL